MDKDTISIRGAREHNLKNIDLDLPKNKLIVFTGVSGSGKSSLAFDTIFAEGQRRYIESLSTYARQFLGQKDKPDVDSIEGLSPAISIDQRTGRHNPRSTVATITEIYDYLRVLYARIGQPYCPRDKTAITKRSVEEMADYVSNKISHLTQEDLGGKNELAILGPVVRGRKGEYHQLLYDLYLAGFSEVRVNSQYLPLGERITLSRYKSHTIEVVIDRIPSDHFQAGTSANGRLTEAIESGLEQAKDLIKVIFPNGQEEVLSSKYTCSKCNYSFVEIEPRLFSFNSPFGACGHCHGLGIEYYWSNQPCSECAGARLKPDALAVKLSGKNINDLTSLTPGATLDFLTDLKLDERQSKISQRLLSEVTNRLQFLLDVGLNYIALNRTADTLSGGEAQRIRLASQIGTRLTGAIYVLDEPTISLHQRDNERLIKTLEKLRDIGNTVLVVEHDQATIASADYLVDIGPRAGRQGGSIIAQGKLESLLSQKASQENPDSLTLKYLIGIEKIELPKKRRPLVSGRVLTLVGAQGNNLTNITVDFPLGLFNLVTGVSGSGKSTLINDTLARAVKTELGGQDHQPAKFKLLRGLNQIDKLIEVDQSPIGRTPRSNPATYTGVFSHIRDLYTQLPKSRERAYQPGRFSFNVPIHRGGGRCEACQGEGFQTIEMHFLPDVYVACDVCQGKRFSRDTLEIEFKGKNIASVLEQTVDEAADFFKNVPKISDRLKTLQNVGLGYIQLGQGAPTLSGGEAQRVKLAAELNKRPTGRTVYILDEPTVGLHWEDIKHLLKVLNRLVDRGNTVIVIEHNLDVIKQADWIIDLGPEGGESGGRIVATGPPEMIVKNKKSKTGEWLRSVLTP